MIPDGLIDRYIDARLTIKHLDRVRFLEDFFLSKWKKYIGKHSFMVWNLCAFEYVAKVREKCWNIRSLLRFSSNPFFFSFRRVRGRWPVAINIMPLFSDVLVAPFYIEEVYKIFYFALIKWRAMRAWIYYHFVNTSYELYAFFCCLFILFSRLMYSLMNESLRECSLECFDLLFYTRVIY